MEIKICDRCKKVFKKESMMGYVGVFKKDTAHCDHLFDVCHDCLKWLINEFVEKEEWEEKT